MGAKAWIRDEKTRLKKYGRKTIRLKMNKFKEITAARKLLELPETASMLKIKANFRRLLAEWHPDKCLENKKKCTEMTRRIISAHKKIMNYCEHYQYSFSKETVKRHLSPEEWWFDRFGDYPLWGKGNKPE